MDRSSGDEQRAAGSSGSTGSGMVRHAERGGQTGGPRSGAQAPKLWTDERAATLKAEFEKLRQVDPAVAAPIRNIIREVCREISGVHRQLVEIRAQVHDMATKQDIAQLDSRMEHWVHMLLGAIDAERERGRTRFPIDTKNRHLNFVRNARHGKCPGGCGRQLFKAGNSFELVEGAEYDHFNGNPQSVSDANCWILCHECHTQKTRGTNQKQFEDLHRGYEAERTLWEEKHQPSLPKITPH